MNTSLYQINTKVLLGELAHERGLDSIPDAILDKASADGFDMVWFLGVWSTGAVGREISRTRPEWRDEYRSALPLLQESDICGSPFAVYSYSVASELGGDAALMRLRERLSKRGIRLLLDFVPNHVALDHPWVIERPDFFIEGSEQDLHQQPNDFVRLPNGRIFAYGRDPYYPGWPDTLQLNYFNPDLRAQMVLELLRVAALCDGVRCDMAMLLEPEVFTSTWAGRNGSFPAELPHFWPAAIQSVKEHFPNFTFIAEVYWGYEHTLQQHGFDYTYDKTLYDHLIHSSAPAVRQHLSAPLSYQKKLVRFLENHDEPRIAARVSFDHSCAMALLSYFAPGMRFFHRGQFEGHRVRVPVHLARGPVERVDPQVAAFYQRILPIVQSQASRHGEWKLLSCNEAWSGNSSNENFVSYLITHNTDWLFIVVNLAPYRGQCRVVLPERLFSSTAAPLVDLLTDTRYDRSVQELTGNGLFIECDGYKGHIFSPDRRTP